MVPTINYPLILTLLLSALFHGILLLGLDELKFFPPSTPTPLPLEIILVPFKQEEAPKKPTPLTQTNRIDKDEKEEKHPPAPEAPSPLATPPQVHSTPTIQPAPTAPAKQRRPPPKQAAGPPLLTQKQVTLATSKPQQLPALTSPEVPETISPPRPSARELIAALEGQLAREIQRYANQPRKRHLDSSTTEYAATAYLDAWRKKIERVGRMNYPEEAKRRGLSGSLILVVDLNPNGTVANIVMRHSSGHQALDKAAIRIVRLAAPFANVPDNVLRGHDILSITRTWQFHSGKDFSSR
ncbi:TonB family protein [Nitrosococcus watsonii C-113]|uniref:TonB family protein n=2 Tax=Nitrosococcus TaxID=1227 RepID=D8KAS3_NITWC|nr:TonB family protein [Nitrosococcus watsonii C-113]